MDVKEVLARNVRAARWARGEELETVAERAGLRGSKLERIETGEDVSLGVIESLSKSLEVPVSVLLMDGDVVWSLIEVYKDALGPVEEDLRFRSRNKVRELLANGREKEAVETVASELCPDSAPTAAVCAGIGAVSRLRNGPNYLCALARTWAYRKKRQHE